MGNQGLARSLRFFAVAVLAGGSAFASGCADERDPINQVDLGAMPKSFFVGSLLEDPSDDPEFYFRTTLVDVAAGAGSEELFTATDAEPTVRVRWEITQTELLARLSYELIDGTDGSGDKTKPAADAPKTADGKAAGKHTNDGQVVASFRINKQFDIRRDYNAQTGEENNVLKENDTDRPWNQREYIRVDFSQNLITDAYDLDGASQIGLYGAVKWDPIAYQVLDPNDPDAPVIDLEKGYFDITQKAFASPQIIHDEEWGDYPACQLIGEFPRANCNPAETKLRLAFKKVTDTDYEPLDFDGVRMEMFGYFTNDRYGYDDHYGLVDDKWHRFASRWNIWKASHKNEFACNTPELTGAQDPHRDLDHDGNEDECQDVVGRGSRCDEFRHACTIPFRDREVRTIPWHVNRDFPADLFDGAKKVVGAWNDSVRVAIASGRLAECRHTGESGCEAQVGWPARWADDWAPEVGTGPGQVPNVFVLCHNPVDPDAGDDPACGNKGDSPRLGDLRYNSIDYVVSPQEQSPWGIMVDAEDPLTGEKISGSVNQWGAVLDKAAATLADLVQLLNGTTSTDSFISGQDVSSWVKAQSDLGKSTGMGAMGAAERSSRMAAFDPKAMTPFSTGKAASKVGPHQARFKARLEALSSAGKMGLGNAAITQRLAKLRGTDVEAKMISPEVAQRAGFDPTKALSPDGIARATPFGITNPLARRAREAKGLQGRAQRHACRRDAPDADHLLTLAKRAQKLFGTPDPNDKAAVAKNREDIFQWARQQYLVGVFAHEFGHSMGLRHNFAGTFDALNYDDRYWQIRTRDGAVTEACKAGNTDGTSCVGPRYDDPLTAEEVDKGLNAYATSSVMDYPGDQALDMYLIGKYDKAAVRFGYGLTVDVWAADGVSVNGSGDGKAKAYELAAFDDPPDLFGVKYFAKSDSAESRFIHYSQYASRYGLLSGCHDDPNSPIGTTCQAAPLDVVDYRDMQTFAAVPEYASISSENRAVDPKGRMRRGYMFSSDEYADTGNVPSFAYDAGADPYEQTRFLEAAYENRYILDSFRRNRTMFNSWDVSERVQTHYLDAIQLMAKSYAFAMVLEVDDPAAPTKDLLDDGRYGPHAMAATVAFDLFARMLTRPEPGKYCSTADANCYGVTPYGVTQDIFVADPNPIGGTTYPFEVPLVPGRFIHNDFDYGQGYWWDDYQKQVGSFYDKTQAIYYLSEAFDDFVSNSEDDFVDGRYKNVNFATIYPDQMRRLYGALLTGDIQTYAPWTTGGGASTPKLDVEYPAWHTSGGLGTRPATANILNPTFGFIEQLYTMVWGTMLMPTSWKQDFINDARITALTSEDISWPANETYVFKDPGTGITYKAHTVGKEGLFGAQHEKSIGARMLEWANTLILDAYMVDTDPVSGDYLYDTDGTPKLTLDANGKPQANPDLPGGIAALQKYVTNIDMMRQLVSTFVRDPEGSLPDP